MLFTKKELMQKVSVVFVNTWALKITLLQHQKVSLVTKRVPLRSQGSTTSCMPLQHVLPLHAMACTAEEGI